MCMQAQMAQAQAFATPRDTGFFMHDDRTEAEPEAAPAKGAKIGELSTAGTKMLVHNTIYIYMKLDG